jgi:hypothetical protein
MTMQEALVDAEVFGEDEFQKPKRRRIGRRGRAGENAQRVVAR